MNRLSTITVVFIALWVNGAAVVMSQTVPAKSAAAQFATKPTETASKLAQILRAASKSQVFAMPSSRELAHAERLFLETMQSLSQLRGEEAAQSRAADERLDAAATQMTQMTRTAELAKAWSVLNMTFEKLTLDDRPVFILNESFSDRRGRGLYAFDPAGESKQRPSLCVQSPHCFFDKHTRTIGVRLFETGSFSSAGWNTVKRGQADVAHQRQSYFSAFTRAFAACHTNGCVVQLHGFSQENRKTPVGAKADVIVSDGSRSPSRKARAFVQQLRAYFPEQAVALFPNDVHELGAITNAQGGELRSLGHSGFLHLELSSDFRNSLRRDDALRAKILQSILAVCRM